MSFFHLGLSSLSCDQKKQRGSSKASKFYACKLIQQLNAELRDKGCINFKAFLELHERDMRPRIKKNAWLSREPVIRTKLLPCLPLYKTEVFKCA